MFNTLEVVEEKERVANMPHVMWNTINGIDVRGRQGERKIERMMVVRGKSIQAPLCLDGPGE